jgi:hypothetical protein
MWGRTDLRGQVAQRKVGFIVGVRVLWGKSCEDGRGVSARWDLQPLHGPHGIQIHTLMKDNHTHTLLRVCEGGGVV